MTESKNAASGRPVARDAAGPAARNANLQADPALQHGPATATRIAIYGTAIVVVLGAMFYGLSSQSPGPTGTAQTTSSATTVDRSGTSPPNLRDVSPNRELGTTTGTAPAQPTPPQSNPTGTEVDRAKGQAR